MKTCGYCGCENPDGAALCSGCGTDEFEDSTPELGAKDNGNEPPLESEPDPLPPTSDVSPEEEAALCMTCLYPNTPTRYWCKECGAPMTGLCGFGLFESALATGSMWRGAVRGRPKPFVLFGVWILGFPNLLQPLVFFSVQAHGYSLTPSYVSTVPIRGFLWIYIMYRVTQNYLTIPKIKFDE